jgi:hypothetical protein
LRDVFGLVALAATVIAAIANIIVLPTSGLRRSLLALLFCASLVLVLMAGTERERQREATFRDAQRELEHTLQVQRDAVIEAQRRLDRERAVYEDAVNATVTKMREEFKRDLERRATELLASGTATDAAYEAVRDAVQAREGLRFQDARRFLKGDWVLSNTPRMIWSILGQRPVLDLCIGFDESSRLPHELRHFEISRLEGNRVFLRVLPSRGLQDAEEIREISLDMKTERITFLGKTCVRRRLETLGWGLVPVLPE